MLKRIFLTIPIMLVILLSGCSDDKKMTFEEDELFLSIKPKEVTFSAIGGKQRILVTTNGGKYTVNKSNNDAWCSIEVENNVIEIATEEYNSIGEQRSTTLSIKQGNISKEVTVIQTGRQNAPIDRINDWKVIYATTWVASDPPQNILDGNTTSIWHTGYDPSHEGEADMQSKMPQWVIIDMKYASELDSVAICRRTDNNNWDVLEVSVWVGDNPNGKDGTMTKIAQISLPRQIPEKDPETGQWLNSFGTKVSKKVTGRYVKYIVEESKRHVAQISEVYGFGIAYK